MDRVGRRVMEEGEYEAAYQLFEPAFRDACPYDIFVRMGRMEADLETVMKSHERDGEIVGIEVNGDRAFVTSLDYSPARDEFDEDVDEFVKIDGRWFAAYDAEGVEACGSDMYADDLWGPRTRSALRPVHAATHSYS